MPIKQTIEIVWHPMTERPPRFARYLVVEAARLFDEDAVERLRRFEPLSHDSTVFLGELVEFCVFVRARLFKSPHAVSRGLDFAFEYGEIVCHFRSFVQVSVRLHLMTARSRTLYPSFPQC